MSTLFLVDNILNKTVFAKRNNLLNSLVFDGKLDVNLYSPISSSSIEDKPSNYKSNPSVCKMIENSNINISDCSDSEDEKKKIEICCICRNYDYAESHKAGYFNVEKKYICDQCYSRSNPSDKIGSLPMKMSPSHFLNSEDSKITLLSETRNVKPLLKFSVSAILGDMNTPTEDLNKRNGKLNEFILFICVLFIFFKF